MLIKYLNICSVASNWKCFGSHTVSGSVDEMCNFVSAFATNFIEIVCGVNAK